MSKADELKSKNENLFERNTILLNENEQLEKENAELKKKIGIYQIGMYDEIEKRDKKLTKAIGIIKRWYETNRSACIEPSQELIEVTEQFLQADVGTKNYEEQDKILKTRLL